MGLVTIIGAAVRESTLAPGELPDADRRWKARTAMALSAALFALALFGGTRWWKLEDTRFNDSIYEALKGSATLESVGEAPILDFRISDSLWVNRNDTTWLMAHHAPRWSPLIPDHGKLIHVFMIREPDLLAFAHLHPLTGDSVDFRAALPPLPAGRYRVYGDIVHESGFNETISTEVDVRNAVATGPRPTDTDDASRYSSTPPNETRSVLEDGSAMTLDRGGAKYVEGKDASLRFSVVGPDGKPLSLEPYIGMAGHAVVTRDDGSVFVHLHPNGTISMASQMAITMRQPGDSIPGKLGQRIKASDAMHSVAPIPENGIVSFPYAFPSPGKYHMWVQVKHGGRILTGAFAFEVAPAGS